MTTIETNHPAPPSRAPVVIRIRRGENCNGRPTFIATFRDRNNVWQKIEKIEDQPIFSEDRARHLAKERWLSEFNV